MRISDWSSDVCSSDGTEADAVAADALLDEVGRHRLGEADDRRLAGAVDAAVGQAAQRRGDRGHVDERAAAWLQHGRQAGTDHALQRLYVEAEGAVTILFRPGRSDERRGGNE